MNESRTLLLFKKVNNVSETQNKCRKKVMDESRTLLLFKKRK